MKRVLVTGASGLIGGLVLANLSDQYTFSGLSRRPVAGIPHLQADMTDLEAIKPAFRGVDAVLHLAAATGAAAAESWELAMQAMEGTLNVFRAAAEAGVGRVVFMSSGRTMGGWEQDESLPYGKLARGEYDQVAPGWRLLTHLDPPRPDSPYAVSKLFGEGCGRFFAHRTGMSVLCIRLGAVPEDDRPTTPRLFGVYLSQRDAVRLIDRCLDAPPSLLFDIFIAVSDNRYRWRDNSHTTDVLGWAPVDSADSFRRGEP